MAQEYNKLSHITCIAPTESAAFIHQTFALPKSIFTKLQPQPLQLQNRLQYY